MTQSFVFFLNDIFIFWCHHKNISIFFKMKIRKNTHINIIVVSLSIFVKAIVVISSLYLYVILLTMLEKVKTSKYEIQTQKAENLCSFWICVGTRGTKTVEETKNYHRMVILSIYKSYVPSTKQNAEKK